MNGTAVITSDVAVQSSPSNVYGQPCTLLWETSAVTAASHTVDLRAALTATGARSVNAQLQVLRVLV